MKEFIMTQKRYDELVKEEHYLRTEKMQEIAQLIEEARAQGDLSENAEYDAAKDEQGRTAGRIREIEEMLRNAKIIDETALDSSVVSIGNQVKIFNHKTNKELTYKIVGTTEANLFENKISNESPVGKALLGHKQGEIVEVSGPAGTIKLEILSINF